MKVMSEFITLKDTIKVNCAKLQAAVHIRSGFVTIHTAHRLA